MVFNWFYGGLMGFNGDYRGLIWFSQQKTGMLVDIP